MNIRIVFIKKNFKDSQMQSISVFLVLAKCADFRRKNADVSRTSVVRNVIYIFSDLLRVRYSCAKCHHCRICKTYFREGGFLVPPICEQPRKKGPSSIGLISHKSFQQLFVNNHDYSKAMIKFRTKFQFQILLQFYRTA